MRQLCNLSYAVQAESKDDKTGELQRWQLDLERPPPGYAYQNRQSFIAPELDALMNPGRAA